MQSALVDSGYVAHASEIGAWIASLQTPAANAGSSRGTRRPPLLWVLPASLVIILVLMVRPHGISGLVDKAREQ